MESYYDGYGYNFYYGYYGYYEYSVIDAEAVVGSAVFGIIAGLCVVGCIAIVLTCICCAKKGTRKQVVDVNGPPKDGDVSFEQEFQKVDVEYAEQH